jgi:hypothetical protein
MILSGACTIIVLVALAYINGHHSLERHSRGTRTLINVSNCLNTNIYSFLETYGGHSSNLYLNVVHIFNTSVNYTPVAAQDNCFPTLVYNTCCSVVIRS